MPEKELKTLKDIATDPRFCSKLPMFARTELKTALKQEVIKWIKEFQDINEEYRAVLVGGDNKKLKSFIDNCHEWFNKVDDKFTFLERSVNMFNYNTTDNYSRRKINCEILYHGIRMVYFTLMHIFNITDEDLK